MVERTFAAWVEPIADRQRSDRVEVLAFARSIPAEAWSRPSPNEGWTCKDVLAHLAGGNDRFLQTVLRAVTAGEQLDPALVTRDTDAENARGVETRRDWPANRLIAALESDGEGVQELLSKLTDDNKDLRQEGFPMSLGEFLEAVRNEGHDLEHLAQLKAASGEFDG